METYLFVSKLAICFYLLMAIMPLDAAKIDLSRNVTYIDLLCEGYKNGNRGTNAVKTITKMLPIHPGVKEVRFIGGHVGASSVYSHSSLYQAVNAFKEGSSLEWHSGRNENGDGHLHFSFPHLIWYKFASKDAFYPARVSFKARVGSGCGSGYCGATKYQFIGSNDPSCNRYSNWKVLCEDLSGKPFGYNTVKYCKVDAMATDRFSCLGISVLESSYTGYNGVSMSAIRMWAYQF